MIYPKFLTPNSIIGVTAPSCGILSKEEDYNRSIARLKSNNYGVVETENVRTGGDVSSSSEERAKELLELVDNNSINYIMCATGGDFLNDMLPFVDFDVLKNNPKWIMGASDPTNLLYIQTTRNDIATLYGHNAGSFSSQKLHLSQEIAINYLKGEITNQSSYDYYESNRELRENDNYNLDTKVKWYSNKDKVDVTGRIIGGCLDCLRYLPGTEFDYTNSFIEKYKNDGILFYFDIFAMSTEDVYLTLLQLKETGWFKYIKGVIVGRVLYPKNYTSFSYYDAFKKIFDDIPIIMDADIGHVVPKMSIINGCVCNITYENNKGMIKQYLK